jgi:lipoprotein-releasing system permease protein
LNFPFYIAKKVAFSGQKTFSTNIIRIAIAAVALSVAVIVVTTAMVSGFKKSISEKIFGFWGHIHIQDLSANTSFEVAPLSMSAQPFYPSLDTVRQVRYFGEWGWGIRREVEKTTRGGVRHIQVYANKAGVIKTAEQLEGIVLKGIGADYDWEFLKKYLIAGDTLAWQDSTVSDGVIVSEQTAKRLKLKLGDALQVNFVKKVQIIRQFKIVGLYRTGMEEYDRKFALVDIRQIQRLNNWSPDEVGGFEVFLDDIRDLDPIWEDIYYNRLPTTVYASTIKEVYPTIFGWLELQDTNEAVIIALMIIVCFINMTTVLLILILERTNMIGILKALGSSNRDIRQLFLYYAAYILGKGLFWGNLIGIGLCLLQQHFGFITLDEEAYYVKTAPIFLDFGTILWLNLGTLLLNFIILIIPSYLVTRITPVKAIRFK